MASFDENTEAHTVADQFSHEIANKTIVITGPSEKSLGAELAITLAKYSPAQLVLIGRNVEKLQPVLDVIFSTNPNVKGTFIECDISDVSSVHNAAQKICNIVTQIDVLINNAGVMAVREHKTSKQGVEHQLATNYLGHYVLVEELKNKLLLAPAPTVVNITSQAYELAELDYDDPNFTVHRSYNPWVAYGQSKTANIQHTFALARRFHDQKISAFAVHPGLVSQTRLQANNNVDQDLFMEGYKLTIARNPGKEIPIPKDKTLSQGAASILVAAFDPILKDKSPCYIVDCQPEAAREYATSAQNDSQFWKLSERLSKGVAG